MRVGGVNPYSFVPLATPARHEPLSHDALSDGQYSGSFRVTLTARTPILIADGEGNIPRAVGANGGVSSVILPGSGLKGAVRSVHEALCDSCLRIVDLDYVGVHRTTVVSGMMNGWTLAIVQDVEGDLPSRVTVCDEIILVVATGPKRVTGERIWRTGDRFSLPTPKARGPRPKKSYATAPMVHDANGSWVLLVTDTAARPKTLEVKGVKRPTQVHFVAGSIDGQVAGVTPEARRALARALEGAEDLQPHSIEENKGNDEFADVMWPAAGGRIIGRRRRVTKNIPRGAILWVRTRTTDDGVVVTAVRLSQAWRDLGAGAISERIGEAGPCDDPGRLCPSCQVFGSAQEEERGKDLSAEGSTDQRSYAGHVRFVDAVADEEPEILDYKRAPLATPKPTAGQFYLNNQEWEGRADKQPLAHWGSPADKPKRQIRGRKFYWATTANGPAGLPQPDAQGRRHHRSAAQEHHKESQTKQVEVVGKGAVFSTHITFDNLTPAQIGSLIVAIQPKLLWPDRDIVTRVGGGRPFGWGAVSANIPVESFVIETASTRYLGLDDGGGPTFEECVTQFINNSNARDNKALRNLLTLDHVQDSQVHYPNNLDDPFGEPDFSFWIVTRGQKADQRTRPLTPLPDPAGPAHSQRMDVRGEN